MSPDAIAAAEPYTAYFVRPVGEVAADLESFCQLLTKWNKTQNLVSRETLSGIWARHIGDSLQVLRFIRATDRRFVDIGSGGGFPVLPLAIALKGSGARYLLVESNGKKASFLRTAIREIGLDALVEARRAEAGDSRETPDVITARAVAPLPQLLALSAPLMGVETRALFHKGREYRDELTEAAAKWRFDVLVHPSDTDPHGVILELAGVEPRH